jgi:2-amino-4-hydroxy-6-hydroxymethyldihydropteridine diphosphokinase
MPVVGVGIGGSGPGARERVAWAMAQLAQGPHWTLLGKSAAYANPAVGGKTLYPFVNAAGVVETPLGAPTFLRALRAMEARAGRVRLFKDGARTLDLDVLHCDLPWWRGPAVEVPHPRLLQRPFALCPLMEAYRDGKRPLPLFLLAQSARLGWQGRLCRLEG